MWRQIVCLKDFLADLVGNKEERDNWLKIVVLQENSRSVQACGINLNDALHE